MVGPRPMSPASPGRVVPFRNQTTGKSGGERRQRGPARTVVAQPVAKPSYAGASRLIEAMADTVGRKTGRCYCESVWWKWSPATADETIEMVAESGRRRNRSEKKGPSHRGMSAPKGRRRVIGDDLRGTIRSESAGGTGKRGRPPGKVKCNVRVKGQDPSPGANDLAQAGCRPREE